MFCKIKLDSKEKIYSFFNVVHKEECQRFTRARDLLNEVIEMIDWFVLLRLAYQPLARYLEQENTFRL